MNLPELIGLIHDNFTGQDIRYVVDMVEVHQDIPNLRTGNHEVKYLYGSDEVIPFLFECDTSLWELEDWSLPNFQYETDIYRDEVGDYRRMRGTVMINLRRYNI